MVLIGAFVYFASSAEEKAARIHERVKDRHVSDVMIRDPICAPPDETVAQLLNVMSTTAQRDFPVVGLGRCLPRARESPSALARRAGRSREISGRQHPAART